MRCDCGHSEPTKSSRPLPRTRNTLNRLLSTCVLRIIKLSIDALNFLDNGLTPIAISPERRAAKHSSCCIAICGTATTSNSAPTSHRSSLGNHLSSLSTAFTDQVLRRPTGHAPRLQFCQESAMSCQASVKPAGQPREIINNPVLFIRIILGEQSSTFCSQTVLYCPKMVTTTRKSPRETCCS